MIFTIRNMCILHCLVVFSICFFLFLKEELFLVFTIFYYLQISLYFQNSTNTIFFKKTLSRKGDECGQSVGMLWRQTLGDESEAIKFCHPRR